MNPLLFLDFDGVMNSIDLNVAHRAMYRKPTSWLHDIDETRLGILRWIVNMTGAEIVISSTWRIGRTPDWFVGFFEAYDWPMPPIVGCTPRTSEIRGHEINTYLDATYEVRPLYVILDDDSDFYPDQPFVHVDPIVGLSLKHAIACVDILGIKDEKDRDVIEGLRAHVSFERTSPLGKVDITRKT